MRDCLHIRYYLLNCTYFTVLFKVNLSRSQHKNTNRNHRAATDHGAFTDEQAAAATVARPKLYTNDFLVYYELQEGPLLCPSLIIRNDRRSNAR